MDEAGGDVLAGGDPVVAVVGPLPQQAHALAVAQHGDQQTYVLAGRVRGQRGWIIDKVEEVTTGQLVEQFLLQVYGGVDEQTGVGEAGETVPREVLVPELPDDAGQAN